MWDVPSFASEIPIPLLLRWAGWFQRRNDKLADSSGDGGFKATDGEQMKALLRGLQVSYGKR